MPCLLNGPERWGALGLTLVTSTVVFARRTLVLDSYKNALSPLGVLVWIVTLTSGFLFWVTLNTLSAPIALQLTTGALSTALAWLGFVLLVNGRLQYPTRQQWVSLLFYAVTEALVLLQVRLVVGAAPCVFA